MLRTLHKTGSISDSILVSILKGTAKPDKYRKLETFGTCSNFQRNDLKTVIQILLSGNLIKRKASNSKRFELDEAGLNYLKNINVIETTEASLEDYESDIELFNNLKEIRKNTSKKFMQTGYLICPDEVLRKIVNKKPINENELLSINGFNQRMFNKIGKEFLEGIQNFKQKNTKNTDMIQRKENGDIPQNIKETYILLKKGYPLSSIASLRNLSEAVISMQIETIIEYEPDINIKNLISKENIKMIYSEIDKGFTDLKDLKKRLPEKISYSLIRIAVAKYRFTSGSFSSRYQYTQ